MVLRPLITGSSLPNTHTRHRLPGGKNQSLAGESSAKEKGQPDCLLLHSVGNYTATILALSRILTCCGTTNHGASLQLEPRGYAPVPRLITL